MFAVLCMHNKIALFELPLYSTRMTSNVRTQSHHIIFLITSRIKSLPSGNDLIAMALKRGSYNNSIHM